MNTSIAVIIALALCMLSYPTGVFARDTDSAVAASSYAKEEKKLDKKRTELKNEAHEELAKVKESLDHLRDKAAKKGTSLSVGARDAIDRAGKDVDTFENAIAQIDTASETTWKSVEGNVERCKKDAKRSIDNAEDKL